MPRSPSVPSVHGAVQDDPPQIMENLPVGKRLPQRHRSQPLVIYDPSTPAPHSIRARVRSSIPVRYNGNGRLISLVCGPAPISHARRSRPVCRHFSTKIEGFGLDDCAHLGSFGTAAAAASNRAGDVVPDVLVPGSARQCDQECCQAVDDAHTPQGDRRIDVDSSVGLRGVHVPPDRVGRGGAKARLIDRPAHPDEADGGHTHLQVHHPPGQCQRPPLPSADLRLQAFAFACACSRAGSGAHADRRARCVRGGGDTAVASAGQTHEGVISSSGKGGTSHTTAGSGLLASILPWCARSKGSRSQPRHGCGACNCRRLGPAARANLTGAAEMRGGKPQSISMVCGNVTVELT